MKTVILFLHKGFEEVEAVSPIDFLRRAGIQVITVGLGGTRIEGAHGIVVEADIDLEDLDRAIVCDGVVIPGGPGAGGIAMSQKAVALIHRVHDEGGLVAAICAAPVVVLDTLGLLGSRSYTCFMGMEKQAHGGIFHPKAVVQDGNLLTSRAAGTAAEFSEAIIHYLLGPTVARELAERTWQHWIRFD